jgi:hypothetical protein
MNLSTKSILFSIFISSFTVTAKPAENGVENSRLASAKAEARIVVNDFNERISSLSRQAPQVYLTNQQELLVQTILNEVNLLLQQSLAGTLSNINAVQFLVTLSGLTVPPGIIPYVYFFFIDIVSINMIKSINLKHRDKS